MKELLYKPGVQIVGWESLNLLGLKLVGVYSNNKPSIMNPTIK